MDRESHQIPDQLNSSSCSSLLTQLDQLDQLFLSNRQKLKKADFDLWKQMSRKDTIQQAEFLIEQTRNKTIELRQNKSTILRQEKELQQNVHKFQKIQERLNVLRLELARKRAENDRKKKKQFIQNEKIKQIQDQILRNKQRINLGKKLLIEGLAKKSKLLDNEIQQNQIIKVFKQTLATQKAQAQRKADDCKQKKAQVQKLKSQFELKKRQIQDLNLILQQEKQKFRKIVEQNIEMEINEEKQTEEALELIEHQKNVQNALNYLKNNSKKSN